MITCKEDLINTYIENDLGELRDYYLAECKRFGLLINEACYRTASEVIFSKPSDKPFGNVDHNGPDMLYLSVNYGRMKKITLSDLKPTKQYAVLHKGGSHSFQSDKPVGDDVVACFDLVHSEKPLSEDFFDEKPRTKVEHEKVTESIFDLRPDFEAGELFYRLKLGDEVSFHAIESMSSLLIAVSSWNLYRRIETEINWQDEIEEKYDAVKMPRGEASDLYLGSCWDEGAFVDFCVDVAKANGLKLVN